MMPCTTVATTVIERRKFQGKCRAAGIAQISTADADDDDGRDREHYFPTDLLVVVVVSLPPLPPPWPLLLLFLMLQVSSIWYRMLHSCTYSSSTPTRIV
jgi:hypothetical protein